MRQYLQALLCLIVFFGNDVMANPSHAIKRSALLISVENYGGSKDLPGGHKNSEAMKNVLDKLGFQTSLLQDPNSDDIEKTLSKLLNGPVDVLVVYFFGHGVTINSESNLVGFDSRGTVNRIFLVPLSRLVAQVEKGKVPQTLFFLDACRALSDSSATIKGMDGLTTPPKTSNMFFAYAAAPGALAFTPRASESLFTSALADELAIPNQDISVVMRKVRARVSQFTNNIQVPWTEDSLTKPLILNSLIPSGPLAALQGAAMKGDRLALRQLGTAFIEGVNVDKDIERGRAYLEQAAAQNDVEAMLLLGDFEAKGVLAGRGVSGFAWYKRASDLGSPEGSYRLALNIDKHRPAAMTPDSLVMGWLRKARDQSHPDASSLYESLSILYGTEPKDNLSRYLQKLKVRATGNHVPSMVALGKIYASKTAGYTNIKNARFWLDKAAASNNADAMVLRAKLDIDNDGFGADAAKLLESLRPAATLGQGEAMALIGRAYNNGQGVPEDPVEANRWFLNAINFGFTEAYSDMGTQYEQGRGVDRNVESALEYYQMGADKNDPISLRKLAVMHEQGIGTPVHKEKALYLYQRASVLGDARAGASLGVMTSDGYFYGVPSLDVAVTYLKKYALATNDADYILKLAQMTEKGRGTKADTKQAIVLFQKAYDLGSLHAANELGFLYLEGRSNEKNEQKAATFFKDAADRGDQAGIVNYAKLLARTAKTPEDRENALRWAEIAGNTQNDEGWTDYGDVLFYGKLDAQPDKDRAIELFERALRQGNGWAAGSLKRIAESNDEKAIAAGLILVRLAIAENNSVALEALSMVYASADGFSIRQAHRTALEQKANENKDNDAAYLLGIALKEGTFTLKPDYSNALKYLEQATANGLDKAAYALAMLYEDENVPFHNMEMAFSAYEKAIELGNVEGMNNLANFYAKGEYVKKDLMKSFALYKKAAEGGSIEAMFNLAECYVTGASGEISYSKAEIWYEKALDGGLRIATRPLASMIMTRKETERDYARVFRMWWQMARSGDPVVIGKLKDLLTDTNIKASVRERALYLLWVIADNTDLGAKEALNSLLTDKVLIMKNGQPSLKDG